MSKNKKNKQTRYKQKAESIKRLNIELPEDLANYLTNKEAKLLKCMLANYTIQDIAVATGHSRPDVMGKLIDLGRALEAFHLVEECIFPKEVPSADYLRGWNDLKKRIRRMIYGKASWRKTVEKRDPRAKGEGEGTLSSGDIADKDFKDSEE